MVRMLYLRDIDVDVHVRCCACGHSGILPRAMLERRFGPNYPVLSIAPHYRCSVCDSRDTESRPAPPEEAVPMPPSAVEEAPSFDGPLAALRGLLDAARGSRFDDDGDDGEREDGEDHEEDGAPLTPAFQSRFDRPVEPPTHPDPPVAPPVVPPTLSLEELVKDTGGEAEGRQPLWEPVSLAEIASRLDHSEDRDGPAWEDEPEDEAEDLPEIPQRPSSGERAGERAGDRAGRAPDADETLFAMRQFLARDDAEAESAEPVSDFPTDLEEEDEEDLASPAFTSRTLARTDFEDDPADDEEPWELPPEDEDPSDEEILAFAIRDPERNVRRDPPAELPPKRPLPQQAEDLPNRSVRGSDGRDFEDHDASMEKTLAALRSMIEEAAAEPEPPTGSDRPIGKAPAMRIPEDEADDWRNREDENEDRSESETEDDDDPFPIRMSLKDVEPPEAAASPRRSSQEMEIEQAMRSLRDLMEADEPPTPAPARPRRPAFGRDERHQDDRYGDDRHREDDLRGSDDVGFAEPPIQSPPARSEQTVTEPPRRREGKGGEPSALDKTIAALRGMLELDGKRKK